MRRCCLCSLRCDLTPPVPRPLLLHQGVFAGSDTYGDRKMGGEAVKKGMIPSGQAILSDMIAQCYGASDAGCRAPSAPLSPASVAAQDA